ncbi:CatA-like O-acetyltransferase [uncultured Mailhella sp.]|uniref:CatA-like O-acetyltransferase n=1 Tax=uncultured Mailhella sp. TaxID=1981031 RepID=UPI0025FF0551|nr:CatA-like O-acetyltransferase [uncultured Mailhella sp.]
MGEAVFHVVNRETWARSAYFDYYFKTIKCRYNLGADLDITNLQRFRRERGLKFFPVMLYVVMRAVNAHEEFRMAFNERHELGFWEELCPCYTLFHPETETFTDIWSEYSGDFSRFYATVTEDMERYRHVTDKIKARDGQPPNICPVSNVPWLTFTHFAQDSYAESEFFSPLIKFGRYEQRGEKLVIPVSVSVSHAVADGYHTCRLINEMQDMALNPEAFLS